MRDAFRIVMRAPLVFLSAGSSLKKINEKSIRSIDGACHKLMSLGRIILLNGKKKEKNNPLNIFYLFNFISTVLFLRRHQPGGSMTRSARRGRVQASRRIMQNGAGLPVAAPTCTDRSIYRTGGPPRG
ncbi:hypothetical protein ALC57_10759 [Trachymyrmex cornetzi]|uniref:Uncharacterized protein n=1 Tax=Trachymyrmex cornetzi TaxID=471704 RepID=A0A151J3T8_9HYME|nr:hypothetical protein ALC57_10759 [Trachymyrmex cornetzi]